jgi:hypothetical protein
VEEGGREDDEEKTNCENLESVSVLTPGVRKENGIRRRVL